MRNVTPTSLHKAAYQNLPPHAAHYMKYCGSCRTHPIKISSFNFNIFRRGLNFTNSKDTFPGCAVVFKYTCVFIFSISTPTTHVTSPRMQLQNASSLLNITAISLRSIRAQEVHHWTEHSNSCDAKHANVTFPGVRSETLVSLSATSLSCRLSCRGIWFFGLTRLWIPDKDIWPSRPSLVSLSFSALRYEDSTLTNYTAFVLDIAQYLRYYT
jgi:hypothetical protein